MKVKCPRCGRQGYAYKPKRGYLVVRHVMENGKSKNCYIDKL